MRYLLDTNTCIYAIERQPYQVFDRFRAARPGHVSLASIISYQNVAHLCTVRVVGYSARSIVADPQTETAKRRCLSSG